MVKKPANGNTGVQENGSASHKDNSVRHIREDNSVNLNGSVDSNGKVNDSMNSSFTNNELFYLQDKMMVSFQLSNLALQMLADQLRSFLVF